MCLELQQKVRSRSALLHSCVLSTKLLLRARETDCLLLKLTSKMSQTASSILIMCHMEGCLQEGRWCPLARVLVMRGARVKERKESRRPRAQGGPARSWPASLFSLPGSRLPSSALTRRTATASSCPSFSLWSKLLHSAEISTRP